MTAPSDRHLGSLDSLRGIAATSVVLCHFAYFFHETGHANQQWMGPLIVFAKSLGHPAVVFFFVLSGFVLSLSFHKTRQIDFIPYFMKRIFRLYPAFIVTILVITAFISVWQAPDGALSGYMRNSIPKVESAGSLLRTLLLIPAIKGDDAADVVIWSLVYEMRFSLVFPLLAAFCWKMPRTFVVMAIVVYVAARVSLSRLGLTPHFYLEATFGLNALITFFYMPIFCVGIALARLHALSALPAASTAVAAVGLPASIVIFRLGIDDGISAIASAATIWIALKHLAIRQALLARPLTFVGGISYSLYLIHLPIMSVVSLTFIDLASGPFAAALAGAVAASFLLATLLYHFVELPTRSLWVFFMPTTARPTPARSRL